MSRDLHSEVDHLVHTSVDDCKSSLPHVRDMHVLTMARDLAESLGHKSKVTLIEREIRQRNRRAT
jgi:hypothetical protein